MTTENKKQYAYTVIAEDDKVFKCSIDDLAEAVTDKFNFTVDAKNNAFELDVDLLIYELISVEDNPNGSDPISNWKHIETINLRKYATYIWETKDERKEYAGTDIKKLLTDIAERHHKKWLDDQEKTSLTQSSEKVDKYYEDAIQEGDYRDIFPSGEVIIEIDMEPLYKILEKYPLCENNYEKYTQIEII